MKYIFLIIALIIQPLFTWYVYFKQSKDKAAMKMPMLYFSLVYLIVQVCIFFNFCIKIPDDYQIYACLLQGAILVIFLVVEFVLFGSNKYIDKVQQKEQVSICDFKNLIKELEICRLDVTDEENEKIHKLIEELSAITNPELFASKCREIEKQLAIRKIKNTKEKG